MDTMENNSESNIGDTGDATSPVLSSPKHSASAPANLPKFATFAEFLLMAFPELAQVRSAVEYMDLISTPLPKTSTTLLSALQTQLHTMHLSPAYHASVPATAFPKFDKLPIELQTMIWKFAPPRPRTVKLIIHNKDYSSHGDLQWDYTPHSYVRSSMHNPKIPTIYGLLGACKHSRDIAKKVYNLRVKVGYGKKAGHILMDGENDMLFLVGKRYGDQAYFGWHDRDKETHERFAQVFKGLKNLAVLTRALRIMGPEDFKGQSKEDTKMEIAPVLAPFGDLKRLTLVQSRFEEQEYSEDKLWDRPFELVGPEECYAGMFKSVYEFEDVVELSRVIKTGCEKVLGEVKKEVSLEILHMKGHAARYQDDWGSLSTDHYIPEEDFESDDDWFS